MHSQPTVSISQLTISRWTDSILLVTILGTANPASMKRTEAGLYAIKGTSEKVEV